MKCNKWDELGLLFISGETTKEQRKEFQVHMQVCADCKEETDQYYDDKANFFSATLLSESPSKAIDEKIITACSQKPILTSGFNLFSLLWTKKTVLSTILLVFGMSTGVYFSITYFSSGGSGKSVTALKKVSPASSIASSQQPKTSKSDKASLTSNISTSDTSAQQSKDSAKNNSRNVFSSQPQLPQKIITVDLKKE
jgi:hypothetical protein